MKYEVIHCDWAYLGTQKASLQPHPPVHSTNKLSRILIATRAKVEKKVFFWKAGRFGQDDLKKFLDRNR